MAKSKPTPLKDEPMNSSDEICSKIETLIETVNRQNNYLKIIAQNDGFDSEFSFFKHQFDATSAIYEAMVKYLKEHKAKIIVDGKEEAELLKAEELLKKYRILLAEAMELIQNYIAAVSPIPTVVIHEPLPTHTVLATTVNEGNVCISVPTFALVSYQMFLYILLFQALAYYYHGGCLACLSFSLLYHGYR